MYRTSLLRKLLCLLLILSVLLGTGSGVFARQSTPEKTLAEENVPLDLTILLDRSGSMSYPVSDELGDYKSFKCYYPGAILYRDPMYGWYTFDHKDIVESTEIKNEIAKINAYLDTLDKNAYEGYYCATNYLKRNIPYSINYEGYAGEGFASWEPLRYNKSTKQWEMRITNGLWGGDYPGGINTIDFTGGSISNVQVEWMSVTEAYKEYCARNRRNIYTGKQVKPGTYGETPGYTGYYDFVIATPRLTKAVDALETLLYDVYQNNELLPAGQSHRVSILSYGSGVLILGGKYSYRAYDAQTDSAVKVESVLASDLGVSRTATYLDSEAKLDSLIQTLQNPYTYSSSRIDWALEELERNPEILSLDPNRRQVILYVTDSAPTDVEMFDLSIANATLPIAKRLKNQGVEIYTVGVFQGLDDTKGVNRFNSDDLYGPTNLNSYLQLLSSYYPNAVSMDIWGSRADTDTPYYLADGQNGDRLKDIMETIGEHILVKEPEPIPVSIMHSLNLESDISLNYVVSTEAVEQFRSCYMEVEFMDQTVTLKPDVRGALTYFTLDEITAVDLAATAEARLWLEWANGDYYCVSDSYAVADYAYAQLNSTSTPEGLKILCANLLRYGALAQQYKEDQQTSADHAMTEAHRSYLTDLEQLDLAYTAQTLGDVENGVPWMGKTLILDSKVTVKTVFSLADFTGNREDLNLRVSYKDIYGDEESLRIDTMEVYDEPTQTYAFVIEELLAAEMRTPLTMALYEGDRQVSETHIYSVEDYCARRTGLLAELGKALLAYSDAAKDFLSDK